MLLLILVVVVVVGGGGVVVVNAVVVDAAICAMKDVNVVANSFSFLLFNSGIALLCVYIMTQIHDTNNDNDTNNDDNDTNNDDNDTTIMTPIHVT